MFNFSRSKTDNSFYFFIMFLSMAVCSAAHGQSQKLIVVADEWCPYTCAANQGFDGYSIELLRRAVEVAGLESDYRNAPFARLNEEVAAGHWQIHAATDQMFSPKLLIGKVAVSNSRWVYVSNKNSSWKYTGVESLKGKRFAKIEGYAYSKTLMDFYDKKENRHLVVTLSSSTPQVQFLKMMTAGRVDFMVEDESIINYFSKKLNLTEKIVISGFDSEQAFFPGYRNDAAGLKLMNLIDKSLAEVKKDKEFMGALNAKYSTSNQH